MQVFSFLALFESGRSLISALGKVIDELMSGQLKSAIVVIVALVDHVVLQIKTSLYSTRFENNETYSSSMESNPI